MITEDPYEEDYRLEQHASGISITLLLSGVIGVGLILLGLIVNVCF